MSPIIENSQHLSSDSSVLGPSPPRRVAARESNVKNKNV